MAYLEEKQFFFTSHASGIKPGTFSVVNFTGSEGISTAYRFEITLISKEAELDFGAILESPATLYLRPNQALPVHGVLASFEQLNEVDGNVFYKAVLVPRLWKLNLYNVSEIYLEMSFPEILEKVLKEGGLGPLDYELKLLRKYRKWSYVCQYQESHFNFISRWMEREGVYYFFEQDKDGEKLIITDTSMAHVDLPGEKAAHYSPPSGLEAMVQKEAVTAFLCRQKPVVRKVTVQDFNYRKSPPIVEGHADVSPKGQGELHIYGEHVKNNVEATEYAKLRAQEILCRERVYYGESTAAFPRVGYFLELDRHYRNSFNRKYLITMIRHDGSQAAILMAGVNLKLSSEEQRPFYRNSFEAIEEGIQYRPERLTPKPRFHGTINAKVSAEGDGKYAELDEFGRYKVKFPFDRSDRSGQKASRWIRMAQPFAGPDEGMHFPLRKGAEVLLTFMDGDPDRPIIAAAVPGAEGQSVVMDRNSTKNLIKTSGGNQMHFEDLDGKQRILMHSPTANSWVRIGAFNDPPDPYVVSQGDELAVYTDSDGDWELKKINNASFSGTSRKAQTADDTKKAVYRLNSKFHVWNDDGDYKVIDPVLMDVLTMNSTPVVGNTYNIEGEDWKLTTMPATASGEIKKWSFEKTVPGIIPITVPQDYYVYHHGDNYEAVNVEETATLTDNSTPVVGNKYTIKGTEWTLDVAPALANGEIKEWSFHGREQKITLAVKPDVAEVEEVVGDGIRIRSSDNVWIEAENRYAIYMIGGPAEADRDTKVPEGLKYLWDKFYGSEPAFNPAGMQPYKYGDDVPNPVAAADLASMKTLARKGKVQLAKGDTFNTQDGNIYDFGGYWNYNLGNSYAEQFMDQAGVELNKKQTFDKASSGGPNYGSIKGLDGTATIHQNNHGGNVWVSKKIQGASYDYATEIDSLEVKNVCNSITHRYGCYFEEYQYADDGTIFSEVINYEGDGIKYEKSWDGTTLVSYKATNDQSGHIASFEWTAKAEAKAEICMGVSASIKIATEVTLAVEISAGISIDIKLAAALNLKVDLSASLDLEIEGHISGKYTINTVTSEMEGKMLGFKAQKGALVKAEAEQLVLHQLISRLSKREMALVQSGIKLKKEELGLDNYTVKFFA
ncbi:MAG TPA: type VI secretion system tip protein TssI/VgrG [bacterium]|nr:type VI secretion system tip protein TssI/VgrG [bacterium]